MLRVHWLSLGSQDKKPEFLQQKGTIFKGHVQQNLLRKEDTAAAIPEAKVLVLIQGIK